MARATGFAETVTPQRPKPSLHLERADLAGVDSLQVGDTVTLIVKGRVTSVNEEEQGDEAKDTKRFITIRLTSITRRGGDDA